MREGGDAKYKQEHWAQHNKNHWSLGKTLDSHAVKVVVSCNMITLNPLK